MSTNLETEQAIERRLGEYPTAAAADIRWLLAETARLRDAAADEYKLRIAADESATQALLDKTDAQGQARQLFEFNCAQVAEIAELTTRARQQGEEIAALRGQPGMVMVR